MATSARKENRWRRTLQQDNDRVSDQKREIEAAFMERNERKESVKPEPFASRRQVRSWMRANSDGYESMTELAEAANAVLSIQDRALDDESHWVWDEAYDAFNDTNAHRHSV